jgi:hypothetical protein
MSESANGLTDVFVLDKKFTMSSTNSGILSLDKNSVDFTRKLFLNSE